MMIGATRNGKQMMIKLKDGECKEVKFDFACVFLYICNIVMH